MTMGRENQHHLLASRCAEACGAQPGAVEPCAPRKEVALNHFITQQHTGPEMPQWLGWFVAL